MAFKCPYSGCLLSTSCGVKSCNFNLANEPLANHHKRCFLNYLDSLRSSPDTGAIKPQAITDTDFTKLPRHQREEIASFFLKTDEREIQQAYADFYTSLFSILAQDILVSMPKMQMDPIPYRQCCVCGGEGDLWYPKSGALPDGWGYCSYPCFQLKPPPLITLEQSLEIDYRELAVKLEFDLLRSRPKFVSNLVNFVFSGTPML